MRGRGALQRPGLARTLGCGQNPRASEAPRNQSINGEWGGGSGQALLRAAQYMEDREYTQVQKERM